LAAKEAAPSNFSHPPEGLRVDPRAAQAQVSAMSKRSTSTRHDEHVGGMSGSSIGIDEVAVQSIRVDGFAVLRSVFDADELSVEVDDVFRDAFAGEVLQDGSGGIRFASVPMMSERTPVSVSLAVKLADAAALAVGRAVVPGRAKGTTYVGESASHSDNDVNIPSVGFVAYLEPLQAGRGALEVFPGSHRGALPAQALALETQPGDIVAFDEHLFHGSSGGTRRRQWRVDFVADPRTDAETELVRGSFAQIFDPKWDGGYDVDRYPSFGEWWRYTHPEWSSRLTELAVVDMATAYEAAIRERRDRGTVD
jgi:hypothetical protein